MSPRKPADKTEPEPAKTDPLPPSTGRPLTSGQLRAKAAASVLKEAPSGKVAARPAPTVDTRELTVSHWARGRRDALLTAFVSQHSAGRTVKRQPAAWMKMYRDFLTEPRG
ncbi:MAG: hypothetical protein O7G84_01245 [Gammaproteobacteria bacterium]|nr:hypothetical protein [Gammaproteobacteria bacterium]